MSTTMTRARVKNAACGTREEVLSPENAVPGIIGQRLTLEAFQQLAGVLAGYPYVKVVVDRENSQIHFINAARYEFHSAYIGSEILKEDHRLLLARIDEFNKSVYMDPQRRFYLGILALHGKDFFTLETVEVDTMDAEMLRYFYSFVQKHLDPSLPLLFKPANHQQEGFIAEIDPAQVPRIYSHQLFASARFIPLNKGQAQGRLRVFRTEKDYRRESGSIAWHDILVMDRVPDDIPRVAGILNTRHTTPLSHTNVLASGWRIPNAIGLDVLERIEREGLDGRWVEYRVDTDASEIFLREIKKPQELPERPDLRSQPVRMEEPEVVRSPVESLDRLRLSDRSRYGTKAASLGELHRVLQKGSERLLGFYQIQRPPRENLLGHLAAQLHVKGEGRLARASWEFLKSAVRVPRGIAIPFSLHQEFLQSSPRIQQLIGKLKMALELDAQAAIEPLCLQLEQAIRSQRLPDKMRDYIDAQIVKRLGGVRSFVVRSSSNAEDLENFSAAGIYESINHVTTANHLFESVRDVWASLVSPRSVRLRHEVGISLDDCYMGVIIQEEAPSTLGGVLVTKNPAQAGDFRNVYINASKRSVKNVVQGSELPYQFLYNTVEGGGRTLSLGGAKEDLSIDQKASLQKLALAGRLLQSHYSQDYTFSTPLDIEWVLSGQDLYILQIRPYR